MVKMNIRKLTDLTGTALRTLSRGCVAFGAMLMVVCASLGATTAQAQSPTPSRLANISTRGLVQTGDNVMIGGFIIQGPQPKKVIIRARGPSLAPFGLNALSDPTLELHDGAGAVIATNDNWQTTQIGGIITSDQVSDIQNSGLAPSQAADSAIIATLQPGSYTAIVKGVNGGTGIGIIEVFDLDLRITSVSDSAPIPLTPLTLATNGINLDPTSPVTVSFFNNAGFSVSYQPIRVEADGTVVVAVPLYVDPSTNAITSGTVSMILTQGGNSSPPVSLDIQNLPTLDTYGTQLGEISHAFLVFQAMLLGDKINLLQSAQLLQTSVDTSVAQSDMNTLLLAAIKSRNDVDRIMLDNSTAISWGNLSDDTPVQFDQNSLDIMDRIIAVYLSQQFSGLMGSSSGTGRTAGALSSSDECGPACQIVNQTVSMMVNRTGIVALAQYAQGRGNSTDAALGVGESLTAQLQASSSTIGPVPAAQAGMITGFGHVYINVNHLLDDIFPIASCNADPTCINQEALLMQLQCDAGRVVTSIASTIARIPIVAELENNTASLISGTLGFVSQLANLGNCPGCLTEDDQTTSEVLTAPILGALGQVTGMADISNNQGIAAAQSSLDLCCMGALALGIQGIADPSGDFNLFVPLEVPGTDYSTLTLSAVDPISSNTLSSETVDLSGLNTSQPVQVPTMFGTCDDTDAGNPDGDDPDCD
jgi:hypothetical protein